MLPGFCVYYVFQPVSMRGTEEKQMSQDNRKRKKQQINGSESFQVQKTAVI